MATRLPSRQRNCPSRRRGLEKTSILVESCRLVGNLLEISTVVMKYRSISLLLGLLAGVLIATNGDHPQRAYAAEFVPTPDIMRVIGIKPPVASPAVPSPIVTPADFIAPPPSMIRNVDLTPPPRQWILRDKTWKAMANSRYNFDLNLVPGHEYIGVRVVLPFGS
jgi:hypothetical protein